MNYIFGTHILNTVIYDLTWQTSSNASYEELRKMIHKSDKNRLGKITRERTKQL